MVMGYIRVSSSEQNEGRQLEMLQGKYGIEKLFKEKVSGKNMERTQLQNMLEYVREGDVVYVCDLSRLSRSVIDLLKVVELLENKGVTLVSLKENFDTNTPSGKLMLSMIGAINEFERTNLLERQREGIEIARRAGVYKGRKPIEIPENYEEVYGAWKQGQITATAAAKALSVSRGTFYNWEKKRNGGRQDNRDGDGENIQE